VLNFLQKAEEKAKLGVSQETIDKLVIAKLKIARAEKNIWDSMFN